MPKALAAVFALMLSVSITIPATGQTPRSDDTGQTERSRGKQAREAAKAAEIFADAAATYEQIVDLSLSGRAGAVSITLNSVPGILLRLRPFLENATVARLNSHLQEMQKAEASGNLATVAVTAAESFRYVVIAMKPRMRRAPLEVSIYTYWALRLVILAAAPEVEWTKAAEIASHSENRWIELRRKVRDTNLGILLSENQSGLRDAVARKDAAALKFAGRVQMASAAVLRDYFERIQAMGQTR
jgi:hypothetical protein